MPSPFTSLLHDETFQKVDYPTKQHGYILPSLRMQPDGVEDRYFRSWRPEANAEEKPWQEWQSLKRPKDKRWYRGSSCVLTIKKLIELLYAMHEAKALGLGNRMIRICGRMRPVANIRTIRFGGR